MHNNKVYWAYAEPRFRLGYPELIQKFFYPGGGVPESTLSADRKLMDDSDSSGKAEILA